VRYLRAVFAGVLAAIATLVVWQCLFIGWRIVRMMASGQNDAMVQLPLAPMAIVGSLGFLFGASLVLWHTRPSSSK
jgi:hypothetical protein